MPKYVYECEQCGEFEVDQRIEEPTLREHPGCGKRAQRVIPKTSFSLRGQGWAADGYSNVSIPDKGSSD